VVSGAAVRSFTSTRRPSSGAGARNRAGLAGVLAAQAASWSAARMLLLAVPWLAMTTTGDVAVTAAVATCQTVPYAAGLILAGPVLDQIGPRWISVGGDLISAVAIAVLATAPAHPVWLLALMMAVVGCADGPAAAAKTTLLPLTAADAGQPIERATSWATALERAATTIGPVSAGLLLDDHGPRALWAVAALLAGAALAGTLARTRQIMQPEDGGYLQRLRHGKDFLHGDRSLKALVVMFICTNFLDQLFLATLLPYWAEAHGHGPVVAGTAMSAFAAAAVITALISAWLADRIPRRSAYLAGAILSGPTRFLVLALGAPPAAVIAVFAVAGLGSGVMNPIVETTQVEAIPAALRGRVRASIYAYAWAGIPAASLLTALGGAAVTTLLTTALPAIFGICGGAYLAAVIYPGWRVRWHPPPALQHPNQTATSAAGPEPPRLPADRRAYPLTRAS
jgi:MFS family permease